MGDPRDPDLSAVHAILERIGLEPDAIGLGSIAHAVRKRLQASGSPSVGEYARRLSLDGPAMDELLDELVVPETWFFRDAAPFECLRQWAGEWHARADVGELRVLSAGCSTGEEPYSLAMTLMDAGLAPGQFRIVAADLSPRALDHARHGVYGASSFRQQEAEHLALRDRYCDRSEAGWGVKADLRSAVEFRAANLASPDFLAGEHPFHVVFCRNVLIYFHANARATALANLHRLLGRGGLLYCGHAESRIIAEGPFRRHGRGFLFAFCRADDGPASPTQPAPARSERSPTPRSGRGRQPPSSSVESRSPKEAAIPERKATDPEPASGSLLSAALEAADGGRLEEAERICGQLLAAAPASADAHCLRGVLCQARGAAAEAQQSFERALYLDPRHYESLLHLMALAQQRGEQTAAENFRRRARLAAAGEAK